MRSSRFCRWRGYGRWFASVAGVSPDDDLEIAVVAFDHSRAAFDPIAAVDIAKAIVVVHRRHMNVAADDAFSLVVSRLCRQSLLEGPDIVDRVLDLELRPLRQRPIWGSEHFAECVEDTVGGKCQLVGFIAE